MREIDQPQSLELRDKFASIFASPDRLGLQMEQIAEMFNIKVRTIYDWVKSPVIAKLIRAKRFDNIKIELPKVDMALVKAAKGGDIRAIDLVYQRWDEWMPKSRQEVSGYIEQGEADAEKKARRESVKRFLSGFIESKADEKDPTTAAEKPISDERTD